MSISFADSLKAAQDAVKTTEESENEIAVASALSLDEDYTVDMAVAPAMFSVYSGDDGNWIKHSGYKHFSNYYDDDLSIISNDKNIALNEKQFNITQEENSQLIPFEMPRFYDGFDLSGTTISIHYDTSDKYHGVASPVNVTYNNEKIRFAWLVDGKVTHVAGSVKFEIHADGVTIDDKGNKYAYCWKSKPSDKLNVLKSICSDSNCEESIVLDDSWVQELITSIAENVAQKIADIEVKEQVDAAQEAAANAQSFALEAKTYAENAETTARTVVEEALSNSNYATEDYVDKAVSSVDVSDQLENYALKTYVDDSVSTVNENIQNLNENLQNNYYNKADSDAKLFASLENYATKDDVATAIENADLDSYYKKSETYSKQEIEEKLENVNVDLTGYATETYVDNKADVLSSSINTNAEGISSLGNTVKDLQDTVNGIDTSPRLTYDASYNTEGDYSFVLYEIENEGSSENEVRTEKAKFVIQGGGGGSSTSSVLKIEYITKTPIVTTVNDKVLISYNFSGTDSSGDAVLEGMATWKVAGSIVSTGTVSSGENTFDVTDYLTLGTQKVTLSITDDAGSLVTKSWTVQKIDVHIESTFNDKLTYPIGTISFDYTPYGATSKEVHFILDGIEIGSVTTSASGIPMSYSIPEQEHGSHLLEVYMTAEINNNIIESNHIIKDIIWYDSTSSVPVISCTQQKFTARQYDTTNINYTVYDPTTESPTVILAVDGDVVSTLVLDSNTQVWQYKSVDVGDHVLTITCGETVKTLSATIEKLDINLEPVTSGLAFDFNPIGKSNNDVDRLWSDGDISMTVSDNFDWINGGYQIDENGDQYFCIKSGTSAVIDYKLFEDDAKRNGKEFKLVFKTTNVRKADAVFLSCLDGDESSKIGVQMNVHEAYIYASAGSLYLPYSEEDIIEFEFNINKNTNEIPMVMGYEDGVATRPMVYSDSHNFTQTNPKYITIGSEDCDVYIYRFKAYSTELTDRGILNNFIADARNAEEMISRYNRNQIYDENNQLTPEILAEKCPWLRIIKIEAPHFTNNKSDKVSGTTIQYIYKNGDSKLDNWTAYNSMHSGQGTTSNEYGAAGRNLDLIMNKSGIDGVDPYIVLGDNTRTNKVSLTRDSVEVNYFNVKVNIASSENANNALLQRRYNEYNPYLRPARVNNPKVKDTMEFYNCVVFIKESDPDISTHREFDDCEWHFYAIGNIGDSKKTDKTRLNDASDSLECIVEIMDNTYPNSTFPTGVTDDSGNMVYPISASEWVDGNTAYDTLYADPFDESMTYGWRYSYDDSNPTITQSCIDAWREFYTFVVTSTDEEFKANLKNYFVVDSALYFYLFTTRYTMIDNRAKNTFWHYGKCDDGVYRFDLCFNYDNDKNKMSL